MSMEYIFTVIVPTFNRIGVLRNNLQLLLKQSFRDKYEIIIIDDCSTDETNLFFCNNVISNNVLYIRNEYNVGRAKTRNIGIERAKGKYILMVDDDISVNPNFLEEHYKKHLEFNENVAVVGAILPTNNIPDTAVNKYLNFRHEWCFKEMSINENSLPFNFCKTANLSMSKQLFDKVGLFDERFVKYGGEDTELGYRLYKSNIKMVFAKKAIGYHYHNETAEIFVNKIIQQNDSNNLFLKLHAEFNPQTDSFFTPLYHQQHNIKALIFNIAKRVIFTKMATKINKLFIEFLDKKTVMRKIMVKYALPILKIQTSFLTREKNLENRD